jgi:ppGpp synthetase/RelA/SpoT-type nucleotidyltranferase
MSEVSHQIDVLLLKDNVSLSFPLQHRVKTWQSILEKLGRISIPIANLHEMQDLIGFRLILQFRRDVDRVCLLIRSTFNVIDEYDTLDRLREDQFGYTSKHFVIDLPEAWLVIPAMADMGGIRAELQVRTTAQHIWAAASHTLQYKTEASVPPAVRRAIYRVSALLETVDLEFERVLQERDSYIEQVSTVVEPDEPLNVDLLQTILSSEWPAINHYGLGEAYDALLKDVGHFGILTRTQLVDIIARHYSTAIAEDAEKVQELLAGTEHQTWAPKLQQRLAQGVYRSHVGLTRHALTLEFGDAWWKYVEETYKADRA